MSDPVYDGKNFLHADAASANLASEAAPGNTTITISNISTGLSGLLPRVDASHRVLLTLSAPDNTFREVVAVSGWNAGLSRLTVIRGQEGTVALDWPAGTPIELRVNSKLLGSLPNLDSKGSLNLGNSFHDGVIGAHSVAAGDQSECYADYGIVLGNEAMIAADAANSIVVGRMAQSEAVGGIALGRDAHVNTGSTRAVSLGSEALGYAQDGVAIGTSANVASERAVALGQWATVDGDRSIYACSIGAQSTTWNAAYAFAMGQGSVTRQRLISCGNILWGHRPTRDDNEWSRDVDDGNSRHRAAPLMTIASDVIDLADAESISDIYVPSFKSWRVQMGHTEYWGAYGTRFYPESVDVVIVESASPGGTPAIQISQLNVLACCAAPSQFVNTTGAEYRLNQNILYDFLGIAEGPADRPEYITIRGIKAIVGTEGSLAQGRYAWNTTHDVPVVRTQGDRNLTFVSWHTLTIPYEDFVALYYPPESPGDILASTSITVDAKHQRQKLDVSASHGVGPFRIQTSGLATGTLKCRVIISGFFLTNEAE